MGPIILLILAGSIIALFIWLAFQTPPQTLLGLEREARKKREESSRASSTEDPDGSDAS